MAGDHSSRAAARIDGYTFPAARPVVASVHQMTAATHALVIRVTLVGLITSAHPMTRIDGLGAQKPRAGHGNGDARAGHCSPQMEGSAGADGRGGGGVGRVLHGQDPDRREDGG
jgi:hypothetical protein